MGGIWYYIENEYLEIHKNQYINENLRGENMEGFKYWGIMVKSMTCECEQLIKVICNGVWLLSDPDWGRKLDCKTKETYLDHELHDEENGKEMRTSEKIYILSSPWEVLGKSFQLMGKRVTHLTSGNLKLTKINK